MWELPSFRFGGAVSLIFLNKTKGLLGCGVLPILHREESDAHLQPGSQGP